MMKMFLTILFFFCLFFFVFSYTSLKMEYSQKKIFDFSAFQNFQKGQYAHIPQEFLEWFVGFFEGNGSLIINHRNELNFVLPVDTKDVEILEKIQNT